MPKPVRPIALRGNLAVVPLTQGYEAVVDTVDLPLVAGINWCAHVVKRRDGSVKVVYAVATIAGRPVYLHHRIMRERRRVDHIDCDGLNCRRDNLRFASVGENRHNSRRPANNTSGAKGVHWRKNRSRWVARIMLDGHREVIGMFKSLDEARAAYEKRAVELHKSFARSE
jgi:hypothetical protein